MQWSFVTYWPIFYRQFCLPRFVYEWNYIENCPKVLYQTIKWMWISWNSIMEQGWPYNCDHSGYIVWLLVLLNVQAKMFSVLCSISIVVPHCRLAISTLIPLKMQYDICTFPKRFKDISILKTVWSERELILGLERNLTTFSLFWSRIWQLRDFWTGQ